MATAAAKFKALKEKQAEIEKELEKAGQAAFKESVGEVFEKNPTLRSFSWTQYTPYWNDGDTCVFRAHTDYPAVTFETEDGKTLTYDENYGSYLDEDGEEIDISEPEVRTYEGIYPPPKETKKEPTDPYEKEVERLLTAVSRFLKPFGKEDLLTMYGDHAKVTVHRSGKIETDEHEHS